MATTPIQSYNNFNNFINVSAIQKVVEAAGDTSGYIALKKQSGLNTNQYYLGNNMNPQNSTISEKEANKLGPEFIAKVKKIAARLRCEHINFGYMAMIQCMKSESGLKATAVNRHSGATGLIQFMPKTAASLGTSTAALRNMTALQQLDYVEEYLVRAKRMAGFADSEELSDSQLYALIFMPGRARKNVLASAGTKAYAANKGLDTDHDGAITQADLHKRIEMMA